jgi:hypothetical protein
LAELPEEDEIEKKTENEESEEDGGPGIKPTFGKHRQVTRLQVD